MPGWENLNFTTREDELLIPTNGHGRQANSASVSALLNANPVPHHRHNYRSLEGGDGTGTVIEPWDPAGKKMSASRRTFCLITTFDLILTLLLWIIYTQLTGMHPIWTAFDKQVLQYTFGHSLFDTVMMSCTRFTFIMLAYALCRISHVWVIAVTTSMTCLYLLVKCFLFEFNDDLMGGKNPLSYVVLIISFVLAWVETWMLDFRVIPVEQILKDRARQNDRDALLSSNSNENSHAEGSERPYFSPYHTPEESEDEAEIQNYQSLPSSNSHSRQDIEDYMRKIEKVKVEVWDMLHLDGWKVESGKQLRDGIVYSQNIKKYGRKIFKLQGIVHMPPKDHWEFMIAGQNESPTWNTTILESRDLQVIDESTVITYNISAEAAGGLVSARDFITIRHWFERDGNFLSVAVGATHPDMAVKKQYVRGENGPGGWSFEPVKDEPNQCLFTWLVNTDLKGWIPQKIIDQAMGGVLIQFFKLMTGHIADVKSSQRLVS